MISEKKKDELLQFHGLHPVNNSDADVDDYIDNRAITPDQLKDLENRAAAGDAAVAAQVETDLKHYANRIGTKPEVIAYWKEQLLNNREAAIPVLDALADAVDPKQKGKPIHNRATAGNPKDPTGEIAETAADQKRADLIKNRADTLMAKDGLSAVAAYAKAENEIDAAVK